MSTMGCTLVQLGAEQLSGNKVVLSHVANVTLSPFCSLDYCCSEILIYIYDYILFPSKPHSPMIMSKRHHARIAALQSKYEHQISKRRQTRFSTHTTIAGELLLYT